MERERERERWDVGVGVILKHYCMEKEDPSRQIGVIHVRNFQAQMACNTVPSPSKNLCVDAI